MDELKSKLTIIEYNLREGDLLEAIGSIENILVTTNNMDLANKAYLIKNQYLRNIKKYSLKIFSDVEYNNRSRFLKDNVIQLFNELIELLDEKNGLNTGASGNFEIEETNNNDEYKSNLENSQLVVEELSFEEIKSLLTDNSKVGEVLRHLRKLKPNNNEVILFLSEFNQLKKEIIMGIRSYISPEWRSLIFNISQFIDIESNRSNKD